jgi:hypothetical protein
MGCDANYRRIETKTPDHVMNARAPRSCKLFASHVTSHCFAGVFSCLAFLPCLLVRLSCFQKESSLLLHGVGVLDRSDACRGLAPVSLDLDPKFSHGDAEQFEQSGLVAVEGAAFLAELVIAVEDNLALVELGGHTPFPDGDFQTVREGDVFFGGQVSSARVDDTGGDGKVSGGLDTNQHCPRCRE